MIKKSNDFELGSPGLFGGRSLFWKGNYVENISSSQYAESKKVPFTISINNKGYVHLYALYNSFFYKLSDHDLDSDEILSLIKNLLLKRKQKLDAVKTPAKNKKSKRKAITSDVRTAVWHRDGGACVECGKSDDLHYDHIIPVSKGGGNGIENIQILCAKCNMKKGDKIC